MLKSEIEIGCDYAYRRTLTLGAPFRRVRALHFSNRKRAKIRVLLLDGDDEGDEDWVSLGQLHGPWSHAEEKLAEERQFAAVRTESDEAWDPAVDAPVLQAINVVLESTGEGTGEGVSSWGSDAGLLTLDQRVLDRICFRSRLTSDIEQFGDHAYVKDGRAVLPFAGALRLAKHFAAAEPPAVTEQVGLEERDADRYPLTHDMSSSRRAAFAIARSWANDGCLPDEIAQRESSRVNAEYADVLQRVADLGSKHRRMLRTSQELLAECLANLGAKKHSWLVDRIESHIAELRRAEGLRDAE